MLRNKNNKNGKVYKEIFYLVRKNKILYIFINMCDCELQICCCKECESAFKNSVTSTASAVTNSGVLVYATASASASSEKSFEDAWIKADVEAKRLAKYYAELEANSIDTTFNIIQTEPILTFGITNTGEIITDSLVTESLIINDVIDTTGIINTGDIVTDYLTVNNGSVTAGIINLGVVLTESLIVRIDSTTNGITNIGNIETDSLTINDLLETNGITNTGSIVTDTLTVNAASLTNGITNTGDIETDTLNSITVAKLDPELLNIIIGDSGSNITTGNKNISLGTQALNANTTGAGNVAIGNVVLENNTIGYQNTAIGDSSMQNNTTGFWNTAMGDFAMVNNTTGSKNVGLGGVALEKNTTGQRNVAVGDGALRYNTTGTRNVAVGDTTLNENIEGSYNTVIGDSVNFDSNGPYDYSTAIGYSAQITHSNQIVLGTSNEIVKLLGGLAGSYEIITTANTNLNPLSIPLKTFYTIVLTAAGTIYLPFLETTTGYYIASSVKFKNMTAFNVTIETQLTSNGQQNYIIKNQQTVTTTTFVLLPGYSINLSFAINASNQGIWYE